MGDVGERDIELTEGSAKAEKCLQGSKDKTAWNELLVNKRHEQQNIFK